MRYDDISYPEETASSEKPEPYRPLQVQLCITHCYCSSQAKQIHSLALFLETVQHMIKYRLHSHSRSQREIHMDLKPSRCHMMFKLVQGETGWIMMCQGCVTELKPMWLIIRGYLFTTEAFIKQRQM